MITLMTMNSEPEMMSTSLKAMVMSVQHVTSNQLTKMEQHCMRYNWILWFKYTLAAHLSHLEQPEKVFHLIVERWEETDWRRYCCIGASSDPITIATGVSFLQLLLLSSPMSSNDATCSTRQSSQTILETQACMCIVFLAKHTSNHAYFWQTNQPNQIKKSWATRWL